MLTIISAYTDAKENKIKNKILIPFLIIGLIVSTITGGLDGFISSIIGIILPFIGLYILYMINVLGAGDIKLFCTIGAITGYNFVINNFIYSILAGGVIALLILIFSRTLISKIRKVYIYICNILIFKKINTYQENEETKKLPFAIIILIGTILQLTIKYKFI